MAMGVMTMSDDALDERNMLARAQELCIKRWTKVPGDDTAFGLVRKRDTGELVPLECTDIMQVEALPFGCRLTVNGALYFISSNWAPLGIPNATAHSRAKETLDRHVSWGEITPPPFELFVERYMQFSNHPQVSHGAVLNWLERAIQHVEQAYVLGKETRPAWKDEW